MLISPREIFDMIVMTLAVGYIFMDTFKKPVSDPFHFDTKKGFSKDDFIYACAVVAPCIIIHELAHKFVALGFGLNATFHAAYEWLGVGIVLKLINFGFIFFVPAFVSIGGLGTHLEFALVALAGPLVHAVFWLGSKYYIKTSKNLKQKHRHFLVLTMQINMFLFIFNMLPIPGFDGFGFYSHLLKFI